MRRHAKNAIIPGAIPMILRIDHVSLAVKDYAAAADFFQRLLGAVPGAGASDDGLKFFWRVFSLGDLSRLELVTPTGEGSFLDGFLHRRQGGVHHITLQTDDLQAAMRHLTENTIPFFGYHEYDLCGDRWKEIFIHPKDAFGVLIQIAEFRPELFLAESQNLPADRRWDVTSADGGCRLRLAHPGGGRTAVTLTAQEARQLAADLERSSGGPPAATSETETPSP
jgi:methylmalonyl-CoA/ethylmalonyl-CoA epimerase